VLICLLEEERMFLHFEAGLVWVGFVKQTLDIFLVASSNVRFQLPKVNGGGQFCYR
jgi:hypothetical protein